MQKSVFNFTVPISAGSPLGSNVMDYVMGLQCPVPHMVTRAYVCLCEHAHQWDCLQSNPSSHIKRGGPKTMWTPMRYVSLKLSAIGPQERMTVC